MFTLIKNISVLGLLAIVVTSCSTMNKSECLTANWNTIGYGDGTRGYKASRISQHRSACAEHGIAPNLSAYTAGRNKGLSQYCIPTTGYNRGLSGYSYNGVCSGKNERAFVDALNYGLAIYKEEKILSRLKSNYAQEENYIRKLENNLRLKEDQIVSGRLSKVKALMLLNETKEMAEEMGKAKSNLANLDHDIRSQSRRVSDMRQGRNYN